MRTPLPLRTLPDAVSYALLGHGDGTDEQPAERPETRPYAKEFTGMASGRDLGGGPSAPSLADGNVDEHPCAAAYTIVDCPHCTRPVPSATDHDRVTDVCGPHPPGWRLCWCGHAWTPDTPRA
jgi:hypothetical protein